MNIYLHNFLHCKLRGFVNRVLGGHLALREGKWQEAWENCIPRSFMTFALHQTVWNEDCCLPDRTLCSLIEVYQGFRRICCLHHLSRWINIYFSMVLIWLSVVCSKHVTVICNMRTKGQAHAHGAVYSFCNCTEGTVQWSDTCYCEVDWK